MQIYSACALLTLYSYIICLTAFVFLKLTGCSFNEVLNDVGLYNNAMDLCLNEI